MPLPKHMEVTPNLRKMGQTDHLEISKKVKFPGHAEKLRDIGIKSQGTSCFDASTLAAGWRSVGHPWLQEDVQEQWHHPWGSPAKAWLLNCLTAVCMIESFFWWKAYSDLKRVRQGGVASKIPG